MTRVIHIIDSGGLYGAEVVILNLMEAQKAMGVDPVLLSIGDTGADPKEVEKEARRRGLACIPLRFGKGLNLKGAMKIVDSAIALDAHILHSHGYKGNILLGLLPHKLRRLPAVTTLHGWTSKHWFTKLTLYKSLDALAIKRFHTVISVSSSLLKHPLLRCLGIRPIVIENGIPPLRFDAHSFEKDCPQIAERCSKHRFKVISMGRLSPEKGFDVLVRAITKTVSHGLDTCLVLFGEGGERQALSRLAEAEKIHDRVHFAGYGDKPFRFIPYFDAFVISSYTEGLPITLLEAMQACTPIVATEVGDIPKVLDFGRCGLLASPNDPRELAKAIETVCKEREAAKSRALAAQKRALKVYGLEGMAGKYALQYSLLLSKQQESGNVGLSKI